MLKVLQSVILMHTTPLLVFKDLCEYNNIVFVVITNTLIIYRKNGQKVFVGQANPTILQMTCFYQDSIWPLSQPAHFPPLGYTIAKFTGYNKYSTSVDKMQILNHKITLLDICCIFILLELMWNIFCLAAIHRGIQLSNARKMC